MNKNDIILSMKGIKKSFGGVHALRGVDIQVKKGEVHALIGENGAGKSTLMKILSGAINADSGEIIFENRQYTPKDPLDARLNGISMVYQELNLAPHLTVEENLLLGIEKTKMGFIKRAEFVEKVRDAVNTLSHPDLRPDIKIKDLSPAACQLVEIARGLMTDTRIFVLDEPTSSLSKLDTEHLFDVLRNLKDQGVSIIYISHFLEEVKMICDNFTVIRDGETVGVGNIADTSTERIIELMVGRSLTEMFPNIPHEIGDELFSVEQLGGENLPLDVSFSIRKGEIFGIAGLVGAGRTDTLRVIFGLAGIKKGSIKIAAYSGITGKIYPHEMIAKGISLLSEDRKNEGLALNRTIAENITFSTLKKIGKFGLVGNNTIDSIANQWREQLSIKLGKVTDRADSLSGGNQQKVALARLLAEDAEVFLLDEPTRGVDVGSKVEIFRLIGSLAAKGKCVIIVSSYLPEIMGICDTIAVMHRGRLGKKRNRAEWDEYSIMNEATSGVANQNE